MPPILVAMRVVLVTYIPYVLATTFISGKLFAAVAGTIVLTWRSPWGRTVRRILMRSGWVRFLTVQAWSTVSGLPPRTAGSSSTTLSSASVNKTSTAPGSDVDSFAVPLPALLRFSFSVMENQRWWVGLDWTAALLPSDRPSWSSVAPSLSPLPSPGSLSLPGPATVYLPLPSGPPDMRMKRTSGWRWEDADWRVLVRTIGRDGADHVERIKVELPLDAEGGSAARLVDAVGKGFRRGQNASVDQGSAIKESGSTASLDGLDKEKETALDSPPITHHLATDPDGWVYGDYKWGHCAPKAGIGKYTRTRQWTRVAILEEKIEVVPASTTMNGSPTSDTSSELVGALNLKSEKNSGPLRLRSVKTTFPEEVLSK